MSQVNVHLGSRLRTTVQSRDHQFFSDEPEDVGGENSGPNPYELLLASLGACTVMTLRLYADRKEWKLETVQITLKHWRQHKEDCRDCTGDEPGPFIDRIEMAVTLNGELDQEQRDRLLQIAGRCPVHRTLSRGPKIAVTDASA